MYAPTRFFLLGLLVLRTSGSNGVWAQTPPIQFSELAKNCAPQVHPDTLRALVSVESAGNPYAIGVVNGALAKQPTSIAEAVATAHRLEREGFNFSLGLSQVNRHNLAKFGETYSSIFEPCRNLKTGGAILTECFSRASAQHPHEQIALRAALSCYYSGNFTRGFKPDSPGQPSYVDKVIRASDKPAPMKPVSVPRIETGITPPTEPEKHQSQPQTSFQATPSQGGWVIITPEAATATNTSPPNEKTGEAAVKVRVRSANTDSSSKPFVQFIP